MKNIRKIKVSGADKKTMDGKTQEFLSKKGKKAVTGCPEI